MNPLPDSNPVRAQNTVGAAPVFASALSGHLDARQAAVQVARQCRADLAAQPRGPGEGADAPACDLAILFFSSHHIDDARLIAEAIRTELAPRVLVGVSGESVVGGETELERQPGVSLLAARLPGVNVRVFKTDDLPVVRPDSAGDLDLVRRVAGFGPEHRGTVLLVDPFSVPVNAVLPILAAARDGQAGSTLLRPVRAALRPGARRAPIIGGVASASPRPGGNVLLVNDSIFRAGGVGVSFSGGNLRIDTLVSQGCKPIGKPMVVTAGKRQLITALGGRPALEVLSELLESLDDETKQQVRRGLFVGVAVSEYKSRFGRDDFVIRNLIGIDQSVGRPPKPEDEDSGWSPESEAEPARGPGGAGVGAIAVAHLLKVGQTVQFHVRDARTAGEDLAMLLDAQRLHDRPSGLLLFTCNGRGSRLFNQASHDAGMIARAFARPADETTGAGAPDGPAVLPASLSGVASAKGGRPLGPLVNPVPLAGFCAGGEIGPVGAEGDVYVHGQTACLAIFRSATSA